MDRYRLIMLGLGALLLAAVAVAIGFSPSGEPSTMPSQIERVAPEPGEQVPRQLALTVDLEPGYDIRVFVARIEAGATVWDEVPSDQVDRLRAPDGIFVWAPGPGRLLEQWSPAQRVRIQIEELSGLRNVETFEWSFRTY